MEMTETIKANDTRTVTEFPHRGETVQLSRPMEVVIDEMRNSKSGETYFMAYLAEWKVPSIMGMGDTVDESVEDMLRDLASGWESMVDEPDERLEHFGRLMRDFLRDLVVDTDEWKEDRRRVREHFEYLAGAVDEIIEAADAEDRSDPLGMAFSVVQRVLLPLGKNRPVGEGPGEAYDEAVADAVYVIGQLDMQLRAKVELAEAEKPLVAYAVTWERWFGNEELDREALIGVYRTQAEAEDAMHEAVGKLTAQHPEREVSVEEPRPVQGVLAMVHIKDRSYTDVFAVREPTGAPESFE